MKDAVSPDSVRSLDVKKYYEMAFQMTCDNLYLIPKQ